MLKVVIDTNIVISGIFFGGTPILYSVFLENHILFVNFK